MGYALCIPSTSCTMHTFNIAFKEVEGNILDQIYDKQIWSDIYYETNANVRRGSKPVQFFLTQKVYTI